MQFSQGLMYCPTCKVTRIIVYDIDVEAFYCAKCNTLVQKVSHRGMEQHDGREES